DEHPETVRLEHRVIPSLFALEAELVAEPRAPASQDAKAQVHGVEALARTQLHGLLGGALGDPDDWGPNVRCHILHDTAASRSGDSARYHDDRCSDPKPCARPCAAPSTRLQSSRRERRPTPSRRPSWPRSWVAVSPDSCSPAGPTP